MRSATVIHDTGQIEVEGFSDVRDELYHGIPVMVFAKAEYCYHEDNVLARVRTEAITAIQYRQIQETTVVTDAARNSPASKYEDSDVPF